MKIMLDCSPAKIAEYTERYGFEFWQLRTPLTCYARAPGVPYGLDNGMFGGVLPETWWRLLEETEGDTPMWACAPDIVGDAQRTLELFDYFTPKMPDVPLALVIQDGIEFFPIPWDRFRCVFIGGSTPFKSSPQAFAVAKVAKMMGKWVHVGRVNTAARVRNWVGLADSIDGSGVSRFDHMLEDVLAAIRGEHPQHAMAEL
jgi:hypothetical protein